ncbi:hypothetical protein [Caballeronia choica]|uniref:hypothetical protein n=1 Tax=Caballeronia choica TaxID=326476 RepID=UPI000B3E624A|nr:hypothetical protein [Caballeronia choica]
MDFNQKPNIEKIFEIVAPHIHASTIWPVSLFPDLPDDDYKQVVRSAYAGFGLTPSLESWVRTYHVSSLYTFPYAEQRMVDLLKEIFSDSIVIAFEASPMLKRVFERCAIAYIDVRAHSERFMDDLPLAFISNSPAARNALKAYEHPRAEFERMSNKLRRGFSIIASRDDIPERAVVFLAQTQYDSSVILPNGGFFDARPYLERVQNIVGSYNSTNLLIKPHPLEPDCDVVKALLTLPNSRLTDENVYDSCHRVVYPLLSHSRRLQGMRRNPFISPFTGFQRGSRSEAMCRSCSSTIRRPFGMRF